MHNKINNIDDSAEIGLKEVTDKFVAISKDQILQNRIVLQRFQIFTIIMGVMFILENVIILGVLIFILNKI